MQLLDHVSITVCDLEGAKPFYKAVMAALGAVIAYEKPDAIGFGERNRPNTDVHTYISIFQSAKRPRMRGVTGASAPNQLSRCKPFIKQASNPATARASPDRLGITYHVKI